RKDRPPSGVRLLRDEYVAAREQRRLRHVFENRRAARHATAAGTRSAEYLAPARECARRLRRVAKLEILALLQRERIGRRARREARMLRLSLCDQRSRRVGEHRAATAQLQQLLPREEEHVVALGDHPASCELSTYRQRDPPASAVEERLL